jgi:hypothetical protein
MNRSDEPLFDPRIAGWLEDDPYTAPDQALEVVLAAFPSIKQRHALRAPWRFNPMSAPLKLAVAAAAIAVVGGGAFLLGPWGRTNVGPPGPTASSVTPRPTSAASASPSFDISTPSPREGRATRLPVAFNYVLPAGADLVVAHDDPYMNFYQFRRQNLDDGSWAPALVIRAVTGGRQDPCGVTSANNRPLADPQAFIDYFRTIPTVSVSDVTSTSIDGHSGLSATMQFEPATAACPDVWLWYEDGSITQNGGRQTKRVTILDVDGHHYTLLTPLPGDPLYEASQQLVQSIRFDTSATPSGG